MQAHDEATAKQPSTTTSPLGAAVLMPAQEAAEPEPSTSIHTIKRTKYGVLIFRRFFRRPSAIVGLIILVLLILFAVVGPYIANWDYANPDFLALTAPPSSSHWLGTDGTGSDVFAQLAHGLGRSLIIGITASVLTTILAAIIGTAVAFFEGWFETFGMWVIDLLMVIPSFLLTALLVRSSSGEKGWLYLIFALTVFGWIGSARTLRTLSLSLRDRDYVKAARYMDVPPFKIIVRHLIPNLSSYLVLGAVLGVVYTVGSETSLSYLGVGIKPPDTSLGRMLAGGAGAVLSAPWLVIFPSVVLILLCLSMQLIGDGLRDAFDPNSQATGSVQ